MAKDGTHRGNKSGNYTGAGRKSKPLAEKVVEGKTAKVLGAASLEPETLLTGGEVGDGADLPGMDCPKPGDYLSAKQKDGSPLGADDLYIETWQWLKERDCEKFVSPRLLEAYAQAFARYIQCEEAISQYGLLGKHPTTGGVISSPFVTMSQSYQKQANLLWYEIFEIVKQNCTTDFSAPPQDDVMERLLRARQKR